MTLLLLAVMALVAFGDWAAVAHRYFRIEYLLKPLTLALLIAAAVHADLGPGQTLVVAALVLGLLGDIGLMLTRGGDGADTTTPDRAFLFGLGAFALGHLCYLVAFTRHGLHLLFAVAGALVVAGVAVLALPDVLRAIGTRLGRPLLLAVAGYAALLGAMAVLAVATGSAATGLGGVLFLVSDAILAHDRFVRPLRRGPLLVIVTYHVGQFLIVAGLIRHL